MLKKISLFSGKNLQIINEKYIFALASEKQEHLYIKRAISSVGSEHLVYTEGVGSSSLSSPTLKAKKPALKSRLFLYLRAGLDAQSEVSRPCLGDTNSRIVSVRCSNVIFQVFEISNSSVFGMLSKWPLLPNPSGHSSREYEH